MTPHEAEFDAFEELMSETPVGENHGRTAVQGSVGWEEDLAEMSPPRRMPVDPGAHYEFLGSAGWSSTGPNEGNRGGLTTHYGVLHPDEYVDADEFQHSIEHHLTCSIEEFERWYGSGARGRPRLADVEQRKAVRERVDPVLLAVIEGGGHIEWLARVLGVKDARIYEAAHRAREARARSREADRLHHEEAAAPQRS